jgi:phage portal protein BeeE
MTVTPRQMRTNVLRRRAQMRLGGSALGPPDPWAWLAGDAPAYSSTPAPATEAAALGYPPFGRGVALLASAIATTRWVAERFDGALGVHVAIPDQPSVIQDPYPDVTPWAYRWAAVEDGILYGNHFALYGDMDWRTNRPGFIVPLPADEVWVLQDPGTGNWTWVIGGEEISRGDMLHIPFGNRSGEILGRGILFQYSEWLGSALAAEEFSGAYFAGGTLPPAVLQSPNLVTEDQARDLKDKWREMTNNREPVVLPTGYLLTPVVSNAEQSQLVESRQWSAEMVGMMLGIPSWKFSLPGPTMTYQNVETADIDFIRDGVDRYSAPIAAAFTKFLMPAGTQVRFDWTSRQRADARTTADTLTAYVAGGILSVDEARAVLGRPPMETHAEENTTPEDVPELTPASAIVEG